MKKTITFLIALFWLGFATAQPVNEHYFKFTIDKKVELEKLTRIVSIDYVKGHTVKAYGTAEQLQHLKTKGYSPEMLTRPSLRERVIEMATTTEEMANWDKYPTYSVYKQMMVDFTEDYPSLCRLDTIGSTVDGRKLLDLKITDNPDTQENEPEFFYTSTMHGDETTGFVLMLRLADYLLSNYGSDSQVTDLVDDVEIHINPNANPDGTYTDDNSTVSGATRSNSNYVDLNRNFPDPDDGPNPDGNEWQPETEAMMAFAQNHTFTMSANFHGGAEVANYPWDTWERYPVDHTWFQTVSHVYADNAMEDGPSGYFTSVSSDGVINGYEWYPIYGGRQDFMNYMHNCREVTMEVSDVKLLSSDELPAHWDYNKDAMLLYMEEVLGGFHGTVTNTSGEPLHAEIKAINHDQDMDSSMVFTDPDAGDFHRPIEDGTYNFVAMAEGYVPDTVEITIADNTVTHDFVLEESDPVTLTGTVTYAETGNPMEGVVVEALGTDAAPDTTDANGEYSLDLWENAFTIRASKESYGDVSKDISLTANNNTLDFTLHDEIAEGFEAGNLQSFDWQVSGDADWFVTSDYSYEGNFAAQSGDVDDDQASVLEITVDVLSQGTLSFYRKVSSEEGYDYLKFYIDGTKQDEWAGELDWEQVSYTLSEGSHTLKWEYQKDGYMSDGSDCAWIDEVVFPNIDVSPAQLELSPDTIAMEADVNATVNTALQLTNTGGMGLNYTAEVVDASGQSWISLSNASGNISPGGSKNVNVEMQAPATPQELTANIRISHDASETDTIVPVTLTVNYHPEFTYAPSEIHKTVYLGTQDTVPVIISNTGSGEIEYAWYKESGADNNWLQPEGTPSVLTDQKDTLTVVMDAQNVDSADYQSYVVFENQTQNQKDTLWVTMQAREAPQLVLSQETIEEEMPVDSTRDISLTLTNEGGSAMNYDVSIAGQDNNWLSLSTAHGYLEAAESEELSLSVSTPADDTTLTAEVTFNTLETDSTTTLPVSIAVYSESDLQLSPDSLHWEMTVGDSLPRAQVYIQNNGSGVVPYTLKVVEQEATAWAALSDTAGTVSNETDSATLKVITDTLSPGNYKADVILTNIENQHKDTLAAELDVWHKPVLIPEKDTVFAEVRANQEQEVAIAISKQGNQPISYTTSVLSAEADWLSLVADAGVVENEQTDSLRFRFAPGDMEPDTYSIKVVITNDVSANDTLVAQMSVLSPVGISRAHNNRMKMYPQPFANRLHLELPGKERAVIRLMDINGSLKSRIQVDAREIIIRRWNTLPAGIYIIEVKQGQRSWQQLIEKQ